MMESTTQFAVLPTLRNGSNQASTGNGISPQHKSGQNSGFGFLYGTNLSFHNHNSVPQKYAHESLYHPEHGTVTYYNDQTTSNISNQNTSYTSFPIGYHVPLSSHLNGTQNFQFPEHEHVGKWTTATLSAKLDHENDTQPTIRSGLGLLVDSATSNSSGGDPREADGPNGTGLYTVPFDVSGGTHAFQGTHGGVTSRPPASSDIGPLGSFADTNDYLSGSRSRSIEQQHNTSDEHGYIRMKETEGFWRLGPMSPIVHADTINHTVPSTMVPLVSPTTNMYHLFPDQLVQCIKLHPQNPRSHHLYTEALRQPPGTHPPTLLDHYDGSSKTTSQSKESQGLCTMCGLSQTSFVVEPCGHFYHTQCAASLRKKAQKVCFCGQKIHHFRSVCQSHGQNPQFTSKRVSDNLPEFCEPDRPSRSGINLVGRNDPAFDVSDSISFSNREMLGPESDSNHLGNHPPNLFMIDSNQYFIRNGDHTTPFKNAVPMAQSTGSKLSRREYRKLRTCAVEGCNRTIRSRGLCKAHGGGKRCDKPGCNLSDQGGGRCINHGGGKRCQVKDCKNSAQSKGLCKQHGGGSRCTHPGCSKSSQGYGRCRAHGGGRRCRVEGCEKTDRRGGYCVTHGADRKCTVLECMKTARMQGLCTNHYFGKHPVPGTRNAYM